MPWVEDGMQPGRALSAFTNGLGEEADPNADIPLKNGRT
jgi:hypothetical protein